MMFGTVWTQMNRAEPLNEILWATIYLVEPNEDLSNTQLLFNQTQHVTVCVDKCKNKHHLKIKSPAGKQK